MYTVGRMIEDARKIASEATGQYFLDIALMAAEEALADFYSHEWNFGTGEGSIATIAPYDTGTVTLTNGSANVVGVGTAWNTSWPTPAILRPDSDNGEPLVVTSFNSTTGLTLDRAWPFTTPSAPVTYSLEFPCYPISEYIAISGVMLAQTTWQSPLVIKSLQEILWDRNYWTPRVYPYAFFLIPGDGTTEAKLVLDPAPSEVQTVRFRYTRAVPTFRCLVGSGNSTEEGGLASLANAATALTGTNTSWLKLGYSLVGHYFEHADQTDVYALVSAVASDTAATVSSNWTGRSVTTGSYYISPQILMPDDFRPMLRDLMRWKYFQNAMEAEHAAEAEKRYRRNFSFAMRRTNRMRSGRTPAPIALGGWDSCVGPPPMPWKLVMEYNPP